MEAPCLAVARFQKPHGLKGEAIIFPLTDEPEAVFVPGRQLLPVDDEGHPVGEAIEVERARPYHRRWLFKFRGMDDRDALQGWQNRLLGVPVGELTPPADDELYEHEVAGATIEVDGKVVGTGGGLLDIPAGRLLEVRLTDGREVLVPFRPPIVVAVVRATRTIVLDPPAGLLELD